MKINEAKNQYNVEGYVWDGGYLCRLLRYYLNILEVTEKDVRSKEGRKHSLPSLVGSAIVFVLNGFRSLKKLSTNHNVHRPYI